MASAPGKTAEPDYYAIAGEAIEGWASDNHRDWKSYVWMQKSPKADGLFTENTWQSQSTGIVQRFNNMIAPHKVAVAQSEKRAYHGQKLKVFRKFLARRASGKDTATS